MSDEKDIKKEESSQEVSAPTKVTADKEEKKEKKVEKESADVKVEKKEKAPTEEKQEEKTEKQTESQLEELPDEIKKKLEKRKLEKDKKGKGRKKKKKAPKSVSFGNAYIKATYNNTIVTLTDADGNVISWASAGIAGFKGPKKSTPYAASIITRIAAEKAKEEYGLEEVNVFVRGVGTGRESAIRALNANGLNVVAIKDITPIPHNGCRKRKPRRV